MDILVFDMCKKTYLQRYHKYSLVSREVTYF